MLHLYINFSCKAVKVSKTLVHLLFNCQLFKAELLWNKTLEIFLPPKFVNQWRISHVCVRAFTSLFLPCCYLGCLMQQISKCSSEHTCLLVLWENKVLSKNLPCKTYRKSSTCSFLSTQTVTQYIMHVDHSLLWMTHCAELSINGKCSHHILWNTFFFFLIYFCHWLFEIFKLGLTCVRPNSEGAPGPTAWSVFLHA